MTSFRIAHLIANQNNRSVVVPESYTIPKNAISPGFSVENIELKSNVSTLNELDRTLLELSFVETGLRAAKAGFDAILVTPFKDYGVRDLRHAVDIPVIGGGQAAMQIASGLGRRFAIVTVYSPMLRGLYEQHLADCGFSERCSEVQFVTEENELLNLFSENGEIHQMGATRRGRLLDRIEAASREALQNGADSIVLGCTCMTPIRDELQRRLGGPAVVDPLLSGYKFAEMMLSLGLKHHRKQPSMHADQLETMFAAVAAASPVSTNDACEDRCELLDAG